MDVFEKRRQQLKVSSNTPNNGAVEDIFTKRRNELENEAIKIKQQDVKLGQEFIQKQQGMMDFMNKPLPKVAPRNTIPYVETLKEVPKNFKSGNILGGLGNTVKGAGQMTLQGLQNIANAPLIASKALMGKGVDLNPNMTAESYIRDVGGEMGNKLADTTTGKALINTWGAVVDPLTWVGGGIASDVAKARKVGTTGLLNDAKVGQKVSSKLPMYAEQTIKKEPLQLPSASRALLPKKAMSKIEALPIKPQSNKTLKQGATEFYNSAVKDYTDAIETIQNRFGTKELRQNEVNLIKSEMGIDLDELVNKVAKGEDFINNPSKFASYERSRLAAGVTTPKENQFMDDLVTYKTAQDNLKDNSLKVNQNPYQNAVGKKELPFRQYKGLNDNISQPNKSNVITPPISKKLPKQNAANKLDNTSQFRTNTIERSMIIPDEVKTKLNSQEFDYIPQTSKEWQDKAAQNITTNRDKVMNDIKQASSISGGVQAHEAAIVTSQLLDEVKQTGNVSTLKSWLKTVSEKTRETARALKGTDTAWDKKSAEGALTDAQRVVDKIESDIEKVNPNLIKKINEETQRRVKEFTNLGKTVDPQEIRDMVKRDYKVPTLSDEDVKFIVDNMGNAKLAADGSYQQRMLHSKVAQRIAEKIPSTGLEKFQAAQRISMLLNPKSTVVRNPLGNKLLGTLENTKKYTFGVPIDKATTAIRNIGREKKGLPLYERTQLFNPIQHTIESTKGAAKGVKEWALDIKNGVDTSPVGGGVELPTKVKIFNEDIGNAVSRTVAKAANKIHYVVGKALKLGDTPFYNAAYTSRIAELKKIKGTTIVTDAMKEDAMAFGLERTLQNDSGMAALFTGLKRADFLNKHPGAKTTYQFVANLILPFAKTPSNILNLFLDYSAIGTLKATGHAIGTAGKGTFNQKKFVDTLARSLTGTGLATVGYLMASKGLITGARDPNSKVENIETALGKQNYAFKVGDNYHTFSWALPAAAPLAMGADIYNAVNKTKEGQNAILKGTESAINLLFNSTLLSGPSGFTGGYSPATAIGKGLLNTTTQATPTAGKQIAQLVDPYQRETYDPNSFKQTLNKTIARIPFASKSLPIKQDVLGNDVKAFQGKNNVFNVMFNPGFSTTYKPDATQKEIIRLYQDSGQTSQLPTVADKYISETTKHPRINLTTEEYTQYQKRIGQLTINGGSIGDSLIPFNGFKNIMEQPAYKNATDTKDKTADEVRAEMLGKIVERAKAQAKKEILAKRGY